MRQIILFILLSIGFQSYAEHASLELSFEYRVDSVRANPNLSPGKSEVVVYILNENFTVEEKILYGYDDEEFEALLNERMTFQFQLDSGEHIFQFFPPKREGFVEITTIPIRVESGTTSYLSVSFRRAMDGGTIHVKKPVIYLYPTQKTDVTVAVNPKGKLSFTYPEYADKWDCTVFPSGEIFIDENSYNYLFWESEQTVEIEELNQTEGMVVLKEDLLLFLESALDAFGFTSKEKMDFITFWAPEMSKHEATEIRFMFNEECTFFADLKIEPKPDNLLRFYMIWNAMDAYYLDETMMLEIPQQTRSGFTVLEWGGMEIPRGDRPESVK